MRVLLTAGLLVIALPAAALAQDGAIDPSKVLAPYVDESTYLIGVVDLQNVGLEPLLERFAKVGMPKEQVAQMKQIAVQTRDDLVRAGGRFVCFTASLDDPLAVKPLLVIPVGKGGKAQAVADVLEKLGINVRIKGDTVLAGKPTTLERARTRKPVAVPELARALAAVAAMPARLAVTAPPAFRKSLDELMPNFPKEPRRRCDRAADARAELGSGRHRPVRRAPPAACDHPDPERRDGRRAAYSGEPVARPDARARTATRVP